MKSEASWPPNKRMLSLYVKVETRGSRLLCPMVFGGFCIFITFIAHLDGCVSGSMHFLINHIFYYIQDVY